MLDFAPIDSLLVRLFRYRTRGFLEMSDFDGRVPGLEGGQEAERTLPYLYVHIPFCEVLCPFCSFHRVQHRAGPARSYFRALREEIRRYRAAGYGFSGAYFGGGTPTSEPEELLETIALVRELFGVRAISVETNPKDLREPLLARLRDAGVSRLSVGVQSFDDDLLREMERFEKYGSGEETVDRIRAAVPFFETLNVDLIFNQPHQTLVKLERDLAVFRSTGANQVSLYPLMSSPTVRRRMAATMGAPDQRRLRRFYGAILEGMQPDFAASSAWCFTRKGNASDEYITASENYVGVGSGAFSYLDGTLYATTFSLEGYARRVNAGLTGITTSHALSPGDRMRYTLLVRMFGLGLDRRWARERYGRGFFWRLWGELRSLELLGAADRTPEGWRLTGRGMFWLMLMMSEFFESVNTYRDAMRAHVKEELDRYGSAVGHAPCTIDVVPESA